jgi:oxygen-independent coproporphyrinogen III oxidase
MSMGLYIHIPFCRKKCFYCDFYSRPYRGAQAEDYLKALLRQLDGCTYRFSSVFVGGGTPTVLSDTQLADLLNSIGKKRLRGGEFTVEANPESLTVEKIKIMLDHGVNRLSVGVQSFDDKKLKKLGRIHNAETAQEKILLAHKMGFKNISLDLIFGVWGESLSDWKNDLAAAAVLPVKHISAYALSYEKNTPLSKMVNRDAMKRPSDACVAAMYELAMSFLPAQGFLQYEVSNFALKGFECRHNLNYWDNGEYLGLGPSAVSYVNGVRSRNRARLHDYIKRVNMGKSLIVSREKLSPEKSRREAAAIKIRTAAGIVFDPLFSNEINGLLKRGLIEYCRNKRGIRLTPKGFLFCDEVSAAFV